MGSTNSGSTSLEGSGKYKCCRDIPWFDCMFPPKEERLALVDAQKHRRFIKTHLPVDSLILSPKAKYIFVGRDGRDVIWSLQQPSSEF